MRPCAVKTAVGAAKKSSRLTYIIYVNIALCLFVFEVINRYKAHWNIDLHLKPVRLANVGQAAGTIAPAMKPNRAPYMVKDLYRSADYSMMRTSLQPGVGSGRRGGRSDARGSGPEVKEQMGQPGFWSAHLWLLIWREPALFFGSDRFPVLAQEINELWMGPEPVAKEQRPWCVLPSGGNLEKQKEAAAPRDGLR
ncbi:hypothetical protein GWK47_028791 [Chionoecetes opilio]|uniref:Uncharacterized protein n=1 Tax=Chionoecetes opilio TaxID=41210 RepID=A0A8J4YNF5_CHIOP|nr:hypothetical protein GWK47_028791 [Chionoecetes opilio]